MSVLTPDYQTPERMAQKLRAIPLPDLEHKRVLDCGTDFGFWAFLAASRGACRVLGLDRNREVRGHGLVDLIERNSNQAALQAIDACTFEHQHLGRDWREHGVFDVIFVFSMYHHWFEQCGDHSAIWYWLWRHCAAEGQVLFEGPLDDRDPVVRANVSDAHRHLFNESTIFAAARHYFSVERVGPALHEPTREVWRLWPRLALPDEYVGDAIAGAGGATPAFLHADGRRIREIEGVVGYQPFPGSLNILVRQAIQSFDWDHGYFRAQILDVVARGKGLDVEWKPRWMRFYPLQFGETACHAIRFEGERYPKNALELIAPVRLRDHLQGTEVRFSQLA